MVGQIKTVNFNWNPQFLPKKIRFRFTKSNIYPIEGYESFQYIWWLGGKEQYTRIVNWESQSKIEICLHSDFTNIKVLKILRDFNLLFEQTTHLPHANILSNAIKKGWTAIPRYLSTRKIFLEKKKNK